MSRRRREERMNRAMQYAAAAIVTIAAGCATKGYDKAESTANAARAAKSAVTSLEEATTAGLASLNTLFSEPRQDLKARFQGFSTDVDALTAANSKLARAVASLKT